MKDKKPTIKKTNRKIEDLMIGTPETPELVINIFLSTSGINPSGGPSTGGTKPHGGNEGFAQDGGSKPSSLSPQGGNDPSPNNDNGPGVGVIDKHGGNESSKKITINIYSK